MRLCTSVVNYGGVQGLCGVKKTFFQSASNCADFWRQVEMEAGCKITNYNRIVG